MHEAAARALQFYEDMPYRLPDRPSAGSDRVRLRSEPSFERAAAAAERQTATSARQRVEHQQSPVHEDPPSRPRQEAHAPPRRADGRADLRLIEAEAHPRRADRIATAPMAEVRTMRLEAEQERPKRRRQATAAPGLVGRPDRVAMWAVMLGFFLTAVAAASGHA